MRPKTMILFVIAVGCGLVASIGVSQYLETNGSGPQVTTEKIFVAATNINIGEQLDAQNVRLEEWPKDRIPDGATLTLEELEERYPRTRLYAGEPILQAKLMDSRDRGSEAHTIPEGYRVVSVKVSVESSVSGLVQPGDRVDLVVFLRKSGEVPETGTKTILRDVNVFSVDGDTERSVDEDGQARNVRTISLLVKPDQAETVMLASELGRLFLTLRRPDDATESAGEGATVNGLLGSDGESANEKKNQSTAAQNSEFLNWLNQKSAPSETPSISTAAAVEPVWKMKIMSPNGLREYHWQDAGDMPREVTGGNGPDAPESEPSLSVSEIDSNNGQPVLPDSNSTQGDSEGSAEEDE